ncbi:MAG: enoyl-CoA hydratase/isomerase family protein [Candidatus Bathyarchaeia archaeon]
MNDFPSFQTLVVERFERYIIVKFNRPEKLNAANDVMKRELIKLLDLVAEGGEDVDAVIFTGVGKAFTSGADLGDWLAAIEGKKEPMRTWPADFAIRMASLDRIFIAAVNGSAVGFGFNILLHCDFVLSSSRATFWPPFVKRAIPTELGSTFLISRILGYRKAKQLYLLGDMLNAEQARDVGIVDKIVPDEKLIEEARSLAEKIIGENAPTALRANKRLITQALSSTFGEALTHETLAADKLCTSSDYREATSAFFEKRKPSFRGK